AGQPDRALVHLERASRLDPHDRVLRNRVIAMYVSGGRTEDAARMRDRMGKLASIADDDALPEATREDGPPGLDGLVLAFANQMPGNRRRAVAFLGLREAGNWQSRLLQWLDPMAPDLEKLDLALQRAILQEFDQVASELPDSPVYQERLDRLYRFDRPASRDASSVALLNDVLGSNALFVAEVITAGPVSGQTSDIPTACVKFRRMEIQLRMLSGTAPQDVSILHDGECLSGGLAEHAVLNRRAIAVYVALAVFLVFPIVRGWGTLVVDINLPPRTKGFLHIKIGLRSEPAESERLEHKKEGRIRQILNTVSRYRKQMAGSRTVFRWIPARRREYYVSVRGPLLDASSKEIIGHFIEEQRVRARRGKSVTLTYDMAPKECAVQVDVLWQGAAAKSARVALREQADSLRYARNGAVFYYLGKGSYTICVGALDRAREYSFEITSLDKPIPIVLDLAEDRDLRVRGCEEAVGRYLEGDFESAAIALESAGEVELTHLMRAAHHRQRGDTTAAAAEYESAGLVEEAAEMMAEGSDHQSSAALFEGAGDHDRAAEAYRAAGDFEEAARCYMAAYDYDNAVECYEAVGDVESVISIHEKTGAYLDAAQLAKKFGSFERALQNLQAVERRDPSYGEACRTTADILADRGKFDVAADRMAQAIEFAGGQDADVELHARYAELLEMSGDAETALAAYETVRRLDPSSAHAEERASALRAEVQQTQLAGAPAAANSDAQTQPVESRYEILEELGRGGMGVVLKARDRRLGRIVALKRLPDNLRDNEVVAQLFLREAQAAAALNHRNIVTVYDAGEENGVYHITMELLEMSGDAETAL
ncbi:MAG: protein kinase domain-containing protein, partial [Planctomycetota bacterium]